MTSFEIACMQCGTMYPGASQFCSRTCTNEYLDTMYNFIPETNQEQQEQEGERVRLSIKNRQTQYSPTIKNKAKELSTKDEHTMSKIDKVRKSWTHKNIFVEHHMEGDTIVLH